LKRFYGFSFFLVCFLSLCYSAIADSIVCQAGFGVNNNECQLCTKGHYSFGGENAQCLSCEAGTYVNTIGASSCQTCPAGKYSGAGASSCQTCPAGTYSSAGASQCEPCAEGTYSNSGASSCYQCPAGKYGDDESGSCIECPAGKYSPEPGAHGASGCLPCPLRTYSEAGASQCETCPAGSCCALGIAYRCVKGTWSPGNEVCQATQYNINELAVCQTYEKGAGNSSNYNQPKGTTGNRGIDDNPTAGNQPGGGSGGGGSNTCSSVIEDLSGYKNGFCLHECGGSCTTASTGAASESYCTVKTVKTFKYKGNDNNDKTFEWPKDGSVSEQSVKPSSGVSLGSIQCPAQ